MEKKIQNWIIFVLVIVCMSFLVFHWWRGQTVSAAEIGGFIACGFLAFIIANPDKRLTMPAGFGVSREPLEVPNSKGFESSASGEVVVQSEKAEEVIIKN